MHRLNQVVSHIVQRQPSFQLYNNFSFNSTSSFQSGKLFSTVHI
jgi:hypothetical protein